MTPEALTAALQETFGHPGFRPGQQEIIESVLSGRPTLAVMPTGAGKSLCYQLPAVLLDGLTVVVSPLIALIRDQVRALVASGVAAASLTSLDTREDRQDTLQRLEAGALSLLYVAPERFRNPSFNRLLETKDVALFVVDEAHCISEWGHDFRPDYARLGDVIGRLRPRRVAALTATATAEVRGHIAAQLGLDDPRVIVTGFERANLALSVEESSRGRAKLAATVRALNTWAADGGAAIVYVPTRKKAEEIADALDEAGFGARAYHAGLEPETRRRVEAYFAEAARPVVVATTAFGMGIDRPDVRCVVHFSIPSAVESYYQEVGRAGRDGAPAGGVLIYDSGDLRYAFLKHTASCPTPEAVARCFHVLTAEAAAPRDFDGWVARLEPEVGPAARAALIALEQAGDVALTGAGVERFVEQPTLHPELLEARARRERVRLDAMVGYVTRADCRMRYLVDYFGAAADEASPASARCARCDRCAAPEGRTLEGEPRRHALMALSCVARMRGRWGKGRVADVLVGSRARPVVEAGLEALSTHGLLAGWPRAEVLRLLDALTQAGLTKVTGAEYPKLILTPEGAVALKGDAPLRLALELSRWSQRATDARKPAAPGAEGPLYEALKAWRTETAKALGVPPYVVAHDRLLAAIADTRPTDEAGLAALPGIGPAKLEKYGAQLLQLVAACVSS